MTVQHISIGHVHKVVRHHPVLDQMVITPQAQVSYIFMKGGTSSFHTGPDGDHNTGPSKLYFKKRGTSSHTGPDGDHNTGASKLCFQVSDTEMLSRNKLSLILFQGHHCNSHNI